MLPACTNPGRRSHLIRCRAHGTIQLKNRSKSKHACSDGCRVRRGYSERRGSRLTPSFLVIARDLRENQRSMALRLPKQDYRDIERVIELDFVRATEAAALNSLRWLGRGYKEAADAAASDAIRGMFDLMNICGEVVIGEGIKDEAPGIFKGEQLGTWYPGS